MTKKYEETAKKIGALVERKNAAYGSSFERSGEIMNVLFPDGIQLGQYGDALAMVRVLDKFFRIATRKNAFAESPWEDVAGYGILMATLDKERARNEMDTQGPDVPIEDRYVGIDANTGEPLQLSDVKYIRGTGRGAAVEVSRHPFDKPENRVVTNPAPITRPAPFSAWSSDDGREVPSTYFDGREVPMAQPPIESYEEDEEMLEALERLQEYQEECMSEAEVYREEIGKLLNEPKSIFAEPSPEKFATIRAAIDLANEDNTKRAFDEARKSVFRQLEEEGRGSIAESFRKKN